MDATKAWTIYNDSLLADSDCIQLQLISELDVKHHYVTSALLSSTWRSCRAFTNVTNAIFASQLLLWNIKLLTMFITELSELPLDF